MVEVACQWPACCQIVNWSCRRHNTRGAAWLLLLLKRDDSRSPSLDGVHYVHINIKRRNSLLLAPFCLSPDSSQKRKIFVKWVRRKRRARRQYKYKQRTRCPNRDGRVWDSREGQHWLAKCLQTSIFFSLVIFRFGVRVLYMYKRPYRPKRLCFIVSNRKQDTRKNKSWALIDGWPTRPEWKDAPSPFYQFSPFKRFFCSRRENLGFTQKRRARPTRNHPSPTGILFYFILFFGLFFFFW